MANRVQLAQNVWIRETRNSPLLQLIDWGLGFYFGQAGGLPEVLISMF